MNIQIKPGLSIGDNCQPFIIAEIGSNWRTLDDCLVSIERAKECGADAVKFQLFNYAALYGQRWMEVGEYNDMPLSLPVGWLPKLATCATQNNIEFMCSAFSPELIDAVDPFVNIHKLASAEMCHVRMLEKLRKIGKPLFMSTGAHTIQEIQRSTDLLTVHIGQCTSDGVLDWYETIPLVLMYCVAAYPAQEVEIENIPDMRSRFNTLVGYSDHSLDVAILPKQAVKAGASVIEKHFTVIDADTPDRGHSLDPAQFRNMVGVIRGAHLYPIGPTPEELPMVNRHNRRIIATRDIQMGDEFIEGHNFGIFRALTDMPNALSPFEIDRVIDKLTRSRRNIKAGDGICEGDLQIFYDTHSTKDLEKL